MASFQKLVEEHGRRQRVCIDGYKSTWKVVSSGVPQGSVLGPILFLIFINDLDSKLISSIIKFADDTKLFDIVNTDVDREIIQHDLSQLVDWSDKWLMPFNISKCVVLHLGKSNREYDYDMGDTKLSL